MQDITSQVLARADELMLDAPGQVSVRRIHEITEVRALRAASEALTAEEQQALKQLRLQTMERLDGSVAVTGPKEKERKPGLLGTLLSGLSTDLRVKADSTHTARQTGALVRLPAPIELIDAAQSWAVSCLVAGRVDVDLEPLRRPWLEAKITSE